MTEQESDTSVSLGKDFAEFLGALQLLSPKNQQEVAEELHVHPSAYSRWLTGISAPSRMHDPMLMERFGLTQEEIGLLRLGSAQTKKEARRQAPETMPDTDLYELFLGAFVLRIETGPPLSDAEVALVRFLLDVETANDPLNPHQSS